MTKTVNQIRAETMERSRAFAEVITLRDKLSDARERLAAAETNLAAWPRQPTDHRDRLRNYVSELESSLNQAEVYCLEINPDALRDYDAKLAADAKAAKAASMAQDAAAEIARREAQAKSEAAAQARIEARKRRQAEAVLSE